MATTNIVILYAVIVTLCLFCLSALTIWSRRDVMLRSVALLLSLVSATVAWLAFSELPGKPENISAEDFRKEYLCATITYAKIDNRRGILIVAEKDEHAPSDFLLIEWNIRLAASLQKSQRIAKVNGKGSIIYGAKACVEEGNGKGKGKKKKNPFPGKAKQRGSSGDEQEGADDFSFHPDPVPPLPEKDYGPLYETPLIIPERK